MCTARLEQAQHVAVDLPCRPAGLSSGTGGRGPPVSSSRTVVWYWLLNGVQTTIIYEKATGEIWCNGYVLESVSIAVALVFTTHAEIA